MCEAAMSFNDIPLTLKIFWGGWSTTLQGLIGHGWEIEERLRYIHNKAARLQRNGRYMFLRNRSLGVIARVSVSEGETFEAHSHAYCDFLIAAKQYRSAAAKHSLKAKLADCGIAPEDIPALYNIILELQAQSATTSRRREIELRRAA